MTALARHISDPDRSLARQLQVRSIPTGVRIAVGLLAAAALLWPLLPLLMESLTVDAWSGDLASALLVSLVHGIPAATVGVLLSIPIGWALARLFIPARRLVRALLTLPIVTPAFATALGTSWLFGESWPLLVLSTAGFGLAVGVRLGGGAWLALDPRESETARTLGLTFVQIIRWHYVPVLARPYAAAWALALALAVSSFGAAHLLASSTSPALPEVAAAISEGAPSSGSAAAAILLAIVAGAAVIAFLRWRPEHDISMGDVGFEPLRNVAPRERILLAFAFLTAGILALGPFIALAQGALTIGASEQVTGTHVAAFFQDARPLEVDTMSAFRRSLVLGAGALLIAFPLGFAVAVIVAPLRGWVATLIEAALLLPLFLSVALASGLRLAGLDGPSWLLFVHVGIALPLVVRVILPGTRSRLRSQFEAATVLGASRWSSWSQLAAPALRAQLAVAAVLAMAWSVGEFGAAMLLYRVDSAPVSVVVASALERQTDVADGRAFALAAALTLFVAILFVTIEYRRSRQITEF